MYVSQCLQIFKLDGHGRLNRFYLIIFSLSLVDIVQFLLLAIFVTSK